MELNYDADRKNKRFRWKARIRKNWTEGRDDDLFQVVLSISELVERSKIRPAL